MTRRLLAVCAVLSAASLTAPGIGHAQTFRADKFDIKGDGGTDYVAVEPATGHVFVSRATHMMVIDGATGKVLGDIPNTPGVHGGSARFCEAEIEQHRGPVDFSIPPAPMSVRML